MEDMLGRGVEPEELQQWVERRPRCTIKELAELALASDTACTGRTARTDRTEGSSSLGGDYGVDEASLCQMLRDAGVVLSPCQSQSSQEEEGQYGEEGSEYGYTDLEEDECRDQYDSSLQHPFFNPHLHSFAQGDDRAQASSPVCPGSPHIHQTSSPGLSSRSTPVPNIPFLRLRKEEKKVGVFFIALLAMVQTAQRLKAAEVKSCKETFFNEL